MINGAKNKNMSDITPIKIALYFAVRITDCSALSGWPAPRFWPTKVAAALLIPHAGKIKNITILMAIWYPAEASLCPVYNKACQYDPAAGTNKNCKVPGQAISTNERMISQSGFSYLIV